MIKHDVMSQILYFIYNLHMQIVSVGDVATSYPRRAVKWEVKHLTMLH